MQGRTALYFAAGHGHVDALRLLLDSGASVFAKNTGVSHISAAALQTCFCMCLRLVQQCVEAHALMSIM